jgi:magnesium chelatase family protein
MLTIVRACALIGLDGHIIEVQTDFNPRAGIPSFVLVGLADSAVKESRERVRAAIKNSGLQFPPKGFVVNLSPADLPKTSTAYDLAVAVGVLSSTDQLPLPALERAMFVGELSLDGTVRHVSGILSIAIAARDAGIQHVYVPSGDAKLAAFIPDIAVYPVESLGQLVEHLYGMNPIAPVDRDSVADLLAVQDLDGVTDFADIKGQDHVKRALEIAAAGGHNLLLSGPPGTGKTLLARALPGILPALSLEEALEVTRVYSAADLITGDRPLIQQRPFRAPHHTISYAGMIGGGSTPKPGEVTLAHRGVLFIDEVTEAPGRLIDMLRQPIEDRIVTISRANASVTFPANFLLVLAMNPCACGYLGDPVRACTCTPGMIARYQSRISGPMLDRIDMVVDVPRIEQEKLTSRAHGEPSQAVRQRVEQARATQRARFAHHAGIFANADMHVREVEAYCLLTPQAQQLLEVSVRRMQLSARAYHRILKLSRTIADLAGSEKIDTAHAAEAVQYRPKFAPSA